MIKPSLRFVLIFLCFFLGSVMPVVAEIPLVEKGILDLRGQSFDSREMITLEGEWFVSFGKILDSAQLFVKMQELVERENTSSRIISNLYSLYINSFETTNLPSSWNDVYEYDSMHPGWGVATYILHLRLDAKTENLGLYLPAQSTSFDLWVNGELIHQLGEVGERPEEASPQYRFMYVEIPNELLNQLYVDENERIVQLVLRVSNFSHRRGGAWRPILLADKAQVETYLRFQHAFDGSLAGIFLFLALYNLTRYYYSKRKLKSALVLSGLFFSLMLRALVVGSIFLTFLFPDFSWDWLLRLEYFSAHIIAVYFSILIYILFRRFFKKSMLYLFLGISGLSSLILFTNSIYNYSFLIFVYVYILMIFLGFLSVMMARAWIFRSSGVALGITSIVISFLMIFSETLLFRELAISRELIPLGFLISVVELGSAEEYVIQIFGGLVGIILIVLMAIGLVTRFSHGIYREDYMGLEEIERDLLFRIFPNAKKLKAGEIDIVLAFYHGITLKELRKSLFVSNKRLRKRIKKILKLMGKDSMEELIFEFRMKMKPLPQKWT
jgi:hypothetical protein